MEPAVSRLSIIAEARDSGGAAFQKAEFFRRVRHSRDQAALPMLIPPWRSSGPQYAFQGEDGRVPEPGSWILVVWSGLLWIPPWFIPCFPKTPSIPGTRTRQERDL